MSRYRKGKILKSGSDQTSVPLDSLVKEFLAAHERKGGDDEARSQAAVSCRRAQKSLADSLYPCQNSTVLGADGKPHKSTDDKFVNRLLQFVHVSDPSSRAKAVLAARLAELDMTLKLLNDLASTGVHDAVSEFEANQCAITTYEVIGSVLRLADDNSAIQSTQVQIAQGGST